jgi:hypothetical protein
LPQSGLDLPITVAQSGQFLTQTHVRYDGYGGGFGYGIEEHFARSDRGYAALGLSNDAYGPRADLAGYEQITPQLAQSVSASLFNHFLFGRYALTSTGRRGFATFSVVQVDATQNDDLYLSTQDRPIWRLGTYRLQAGFGLDIHPSDYQAILDSRAMLGASLQSPVVRIAGATLSANYDFTSTSYNYGRQRWLGSLVFWSTRQFGRAWTMNAGATYSQINDRFRTNQDVYYPPIAPGYLTGDGTIYDGLTAYIGNSTFRTYSVGSTYTPSPRFSLATALNYNHDFPQYRGYGRPQYDATIEVRWRRAKGGGIEIGRDIPFGWAGQRYPVFYNIRLIQ